MDRLPAFLKDCYATDFHAADDGFYLGRMAATTDAREKHWARWRAYVAPLGVDPYLLDTPYEHRARALSGYAARVRSGYYSWGHQICSGTVATAITAIGTKISMATGVNPTKDGVSDKLIPRLSQILQGWKAQDPPVVGKLPIEIDIPEFLSHIGQLQQANELDQAIGDLTLITFYYLLQVGKYTIKSKF